MVVAVLLSTALACSLPGSAKPTPTIGPTEPAPTAVSSATPSPVPDPSSLCPAETADTRLYLSLRNGLCFLYPSHYELQPDYERPDDVITLIGPLADPQAQETIAVALSVAYNGTSDGMTSPQYAARWEEIHQAPSEVPGYAETIAGKPGWTLNGVPGYGLERRAFLIVDGFRYSILLVPVPEDVPALEQEANLVWETVTGSLVFFPPQGGQSYVRAEQVCPQETGESRQYVSLRDGYCLLYPADFEPDESFPGSFTGGPVVGVVEGWGEIRTSLTFGTFGAFPGSTAREVLAPRLEFIDAASVQDTSMGGAQAVVFRDPRGPWVSRQAMIIYRGFVYTIVAQPWEPERFPSGIEYLDRVWDTVTGSVAFFNRWN
jgi:hypothetical protein